MDDLQVTLQRKAIKNMYLRVKPPYGEISVSAPLGASDERVASFVRLRRDWIERQRARLRQADGGGVDFGGVAGEGWTPERRAEAAARINAALPGLLATWEPTVGRRPTRITLRLMTSRWGSCTPSTGRIRLNLQLGFMEPRFLEYVLVHEMTHLWERGHGVGFQRRMDTYLPGWRTLRRDLNRQSIG